ncbi:formylglycine-generating enzyme family protein [Algivirga pacifica]|uniref:SUMF1/EgtB/PvdO family nonheme iron enzyme n=1 Tax=Algivirga pacifica TaxID=1162670 RepID=A0ABP9D7G5_9BACT
MKNFRLYTLLFPLCLLLSTTTVPDKKEKKLRKALAQIDQDMVLIQGGRFVMGGDIKKAKRHKVKLKDYYLSKYEVTQTLWETIMEYNPSSFNGCADCPVENISWEEVLLFIEKLNALTGMDYRLPTEAEWEYAAIGAKKERGYTYAGSDQLVNVAWYTQNSFGRTHPVGMKMSNSLGLHDMSGNVYEWCNDWYKKGYYKRWSARKNPQGPRKGKYKVCRGGSWYSGDEYEHVQARNYLRTDIKYKNVGFRLARSVK